MEEKFKELINEAQKILVTSHTSPDPDAVASLLLLGTTLKANYPDKTTVMELEEQPEGLDFLKGYKDIQIDLLDKITADLRPDVFIIVDANNFDRISRHQGDLLRAYISKNNVKTIIIDHHEQSDKDDSDMYINSANPAAVQEVYELLFDGLNLIKPDGFAQTTMVGLYADTGGFAYINPRYKETFKLASSLVSEGANIEQIKSKINQYSEDQIKVLAELMKNLSHERDYTYSFLNDQFVKSWAESNKPLSSLQIARARFINEYIRNIDGRSWGYVVTLDLQQGDNCYSVSFRSISAKPDVCEIARRLGGGGHKAASGADIKAADLNDAILKIKKAIDSGL